MAERLPHGYEIHVTGIGPLSADFDKEAQKDHSKLIFHGAVSVGELYEIVNDCDVILNPHLPLSDEMGGLFPFKVIEAISSGRVLISTDLPRSGFESVLDGVIFVQHDVDSFLQAIIEARLHYEGTGKKISDGAKEAYRRFGEGCVVRMLADAEVI
ncbi:glycosyltransferase family 4 protein [Cupriavidus basilensis]|uniref:glycosyltransferase family 4 protein n=1 Tax=Cupriavidus basilensis TaxID=68895 RepID=UPI0039F66924